MQNQVFVRMGDGERVLMPSDQVKEDLLAGTQDAAQRAEIPQLTSDELEQLLDIFTDTSRIVSVSPGEEVIVTDDAVCTLFYLDQDNSGQGIPMSRVQSVLAYERACAADTVSIGHTDYSYKQVKPIINFEKQEYHTASLMTTAPFFYGSQPNMGLYFQPDGPYPNPADLLPMGKIREAQEAQEEAAEHLRKDMVFISRNLYEVGCEGINFDTSASAGDADFYATLQAVSQLKKDFPDMAVEVGMSSEFVLGMHGEIQFKGKQLAGMYPHEQVKVVEAAGADIFGPAININSSESIPWNLARAVTFVKATAEVARIPVHPNVGMGVCGVPVFEVPPIDAVTRAAKSLVQIGKADGLQVGTGDIFGMPIAHIMAAGMGGIRTAGDLVAWMQMTRKMKIAEAKKYVADKLKIDIIDLSNEEVMRQIREDLDIGIITAVAGSAKGIAAKWKIAELLDIEINSVNLFRPKLV